MFINDVHELSTASISLSANGVIGTAVATVDLFPSFNITATAANLTFGLAPPTDPVSGKVVQVQNVGTFAFTLLSVTVPAGACARVVWSGSVWMPPVAGSTPADFWRSGVGGTALPDGTTDTSENITRAGSVGLNTDPVSTFDVAGSVGNQFTTTAAASYTALNTDATINLTLTGLQTVSLPSSVGVPRRIVTLRNPTTFAKVVTSYVDLNGNSSTTTPPNASITLQSDGTNWQQIDSGSASQNVNNFMQVYASAVVDVGDPTPVGVRGVTNSFNVASASGVDGAGPDSRLNVVFTTPLATTNYNIVGNIVSKVPGGWVNDDKLIFTIVSKATTGFTIAFRETASVFQDVNFSFDVVSRATLAGTPSVAVKSVLVLIDTPVTLDNLIVTPTLTSGRGFTRMRSKRRFFIPADRPAVLHQAGNHRISTYRPRLARQPPAHSAA